GEQAEYSRAVRAGGEVTTQERWSARRPRPAGPFDFAQGRLTRRRSLHYFVITPQAMRSPALPAGSVFWSSGLAWMTSDVPPLLNIEWLPSPQVMSLFSARKCALPSGPTVKLGLSPAWWPSGFSNPCFFPSGLKWPPADLKSGASHFAF